MAGKVFFSVSTSLDGFIAPPGHEAVIGIDRRGEGNVTCPGPQFLDFS